MIDDPVLVNDWHVVERATDVAESGVVSARLLDEDLVLWRRNQRMQEALPAVSGSLSAERRMGRSTKPTDSGTTAGRGCHGLTRCVQVPPPTPQICAIQ